MMTKIIKRCPECSSTLREDNTCKCGWIDEVPKQYRNAHQCIYQFGDRRCPLVGVLSDSITKSDRWFCRAHWQARCDPQLAEALLSDIENNPAIWQTIRKTWREILLNEKFKNKNTFCNLTSKNINDSLLELRKLIIDIEE